jgi:hypothetical protein
VRFTRRLRRIFGWAALILWPALLPHPANAVAACIWYLVLGLSGLVYFLSRIQGDTAQRQEPALARDSNLSASSTSSSRLVASTPGASGQSWPDGSLPLQKRQSESASLRRSLVS